MSGGVLSAPFRRVVLAVAVVAVLVAVAATVHPRARALATPRAGTAPVRTMSALCPSVSGGSAGSSTDMTVASFGSGADVKVSYAPLQPGKGSPQTVTPRPSTVVTKSSPYGSVTLQGNGDGADATTVSQVAITPGGAYRGLTDLACMPPATDWWFAGGDGRIGVADVFFLMNPSDTSANVALSLWSSRGPLNPPGVSGINVPPHTVQWRNLSDLAPDAGDLTLHVHANTGTVGAALLDRRTNSLQPLGSDWIPPTAPPAKTSLVTGFTQGATTDFFVVANPGNVDATVTLRLVTTSKNFQPAGHQTVVVPAGRTVKVDLADAIAGETAAVVASSDAPVVTEGMTLIKPRSGFSELAWMPAQQPLPSPAGIAANAPPFGQYVTLVLTAPHAAAKVTVSRPQGPSATVTVPAGRTSALDLRALLKGAAGAAVGPVQVTPVSGGPVYVERVLYASGAHGPLLAEEVPVTFALPTRLPAVAPDLRVATP